MWVWIFFTAGAVALVRYVDIPGLPMLAVLTFASGVVRYATVVSRASTLEREAAWHIEQANSIASAAGVEAGIAAKFAEGFGDAVLEDAQDVGDLVVGGFAKFAQGYLEESAGGSEAAAHRVAARTKLAEARDLRGSPWSIAAAVLLSCCVVLGLAHAEVIRTPASIRRDAFMAAEYEENRRRQRQEDELDRVAQAACVALDSKVGDFVARSGLRDAPERLATFDAMMAEVVVVRRSARLEWSGTVQGAFDVATAARRRVVADAGVSRSVLRAVDREINGLRRALDSELRSGRRPYNCGR